MMNKGCGLGLAWSAGFHDGEGCVYLHPSKGKSIVSHRPRITEAQKSAEELYQFQSGTGYGKVLGPYKGFYALHVYGISEVCSLIESLYPYLGDVKRRQAVSVLSKFRREVQSWQLGSRIGGDIVLPSELDWSGFEWKWTEKLAWCGGFAVGEGHFGSSKNRCDPIFTASQKDRQVLDRFREFTNVGKVYWQPSICCYRYQVNGIERVQYLGALLWEFLSEKKRGQFRDVLCTYRNRELPGLCRGEKQRYVKNSELQVREMRQLYNDGFSVSEIALRSGNPCHRVRRIVSRKTWKHI